jgi:anti-sigma B factor antagonist
LSTLNTQTHGDVLVVYFTDSRMLDDPRIQQIGTELTAVVERCETGKLLLNFEEVKFMSSAMLGKIMLVQKKCKQGDVKLKLCNISGDIMEVFKMMRLHKVLDIYKEEAKALSSFEKKGLFS